MALSVTESRLDASGFGGGFTPTPERLIPDMDLKTQLVVLARALWRAGHDDPGAGHITINLHDGTFLCNPFRLLWEELQPHQVLRIDHEGVVVEGDWPAPPGIQLHIALHQKRKVEVAMHSHPTYGTVWADVLEVPPAMDQSCGRVSAELVLVNEYGGAVDDLSEANSVVDKLGDAELALLAGHGVMVLGSSVKQIYERAVALELRCQRAWMIRAMGGSLVSPIPQAILDKWKGTPSARYQWESMARLELRTDPSLLEG